MDLLFRVYLDALKIDNTKSKKVFELSTELGLSCGQILHL